MSYERPETRPAGQAPAAAPLVRAETESAATGDLAALKLETEPQTPDVDPVPTHEIAKLTDGESETDAE